MAMELELDDDVFFADISKQISLLIMDEDEHLNPVNLSSSTSLSFQDLSRGGYQTAPYMHHQEQSKGTGVFIPRASQPRRRQQHHHQKQGRFSSFNAKQHHSLYHSRQEYQQNHEHSRSTLTTHNNKKLSMNSTVPIRAYRDPTSIYT